LGPGGSGRLAAFKLTAVQGLELRLEPLVFQFQVLASAALLLQALAQGLDLGLRALFDDGGLLETLQDPAGGPALQIGAAAAIRAREVIRQIWKAGHRQFGGGPWSTRQLTSERRWSSRRTLR
jgi:hypothetical protein